MTTTQPRGGLRPRSVLRLLPVLLLAVTALAAPGAGAPPASATVGHAGTAIPSAVPAAAPQGALSPTGCTRSGSSATCELWAKPGVLAVLGQPLPIWGYAATASGDATAPGPLLVVQQGDTVTVTLHNGLTQNTSLAFPGQPAGAFGAGLDAGTLAGVAPGDSTSYTFQASRPGTFLYEAGHTADGARQTALGLAGGLVVLPSSGPGAYGTDASTYDDEAVLVLTDLDPDLNAHPATFDMRGYHARYRLINGKVFPGTDPVSTGPGRTVLLRYVNAGSLPHPMSLLGGVQRRLAEDARPYDHPLGTVVSDVAPGATMDALVTMPTGSESRVTVFEAGGHLDNAGQTEADPSRVAAGGMMTFLDTQAAPPTTDAVGPVPSHIKLTPNPSTGDAPVTVTADVSDATTGGGTVTYAEVVVDDATSRGVGFGAPMTGTFGTTTVNVTATIPTTAPDCTPGPSGEVPLALSCLSAGRHRVFVRGQDSQGNWGVISDGVLNLPKTGPLSRDGVVDPDPTNGTRTLAVSATADDGGAGGTIDQAEWFLDTLGAAGTGTPMTVNDGGAVAAVSGTVPAGDLAGLVDGVHHVFVRSHDSLGVWGPELDLPFSLDTSGPTVVAAAVAPDPTNGEIDDPGNPGNLVVSALIQDVASGGGQESLLADAEGYLDPGASPDPGAGFALIPVDGVWDSSSEAVYGLIPLSAITGLDEGAHVVRVRGKDAAGTWGELFTASLTVDRTAPVLATPSVAPNPSNGAASVVLQASVDELALGAAEIWYGPDPGVGLATPVQFSVSAGQVLVGLPVPPFTSGNRQVGLRVRDAAGNWSARVTATYRVTAGGAGAAGLLGFARNVGSVTVSRTAGLPKATAGNTGMVATPLHGHPAYVTSSLPSGSPPVGGLDASFSFSRSTLTPGRGRVVTVYDARTATGRLVLALQVRRAEHGRAQVRAVLGRSHAAALTGRWVELRDGAHRVHLTWRAGPAGGPAEARGLLRVGLGREEVIERVADTSGLSIGSVRLGVVDGLSGASGHLYVDGYTAQGQS